MISVLRSDDGDHKGSLAILERVSLLANSGFGVHPHTRVDFLNSLALEQCEVNRLVEAKAMCEIVMRSPYAVRYPEWEDTGQQIAAKQLCPSRSIVSLSCNEVKKTPSVQLQRAANCDRGVKIHRQSIYSNMFKLNRRTFSSAFKSVSRANTNDQKKRSLEWLAVILFEAMLFTYVKKTNTLTVSSEIDLVIGIHTQKAIGPFTELGDCFLVECKNWSVSVGAAQVRDFIGKLNSTQRKMGVLLAKNGISGSGSDCCEKDAVREIRRAFDKDGLYVLVISLEDLGEVFKGANFCDILERKIDCVRFNLRRDVASTSSEEVENQLTDPD